MVVISLAIGFTYEEALSACLTVGPEVLHEGLTDRQTKKALKLLGFTVRMRTKRLNLEKSTGLLRVVDPKGTAHLTYLWGGRIIEPMKSDTTALWLNVADYIKDGKWTVEGLITLEEGE